MNKLLLLAVWLLPVVALAAPVACPGTANSTPAITLSEFNTLFPEGCYQQDKLYSNFTSDAPGETAVTISFQELTIGDRHTVTFSGNFDDATGPFGIAYDVSIFGPNLESMAMVSVSSGILLPSNGSEAVTTTVTDLMTTSVYAPIIASAGGTVTLMLAPVTNALRISNQFDPGTGGATGIANGITEAPIPEPGAGLLLGLGLAAIGLAGRFRSR